MKLHLIGDVHGKQFEYQALLKTIPVSDASIQIGDMGVGFSNDVPFTNPQQHKWFRGNHDDPTKSRAHPNYLSDYGYSPSMDLFWIAGAWSVDWKWRIPDVSWWRDEELSLVELNGVYDYYVATKPRYVISHDCPSSVTDLMFASRADRDEYYKMKLACGSSRTSQALQAMFEAHNPEKWFFGHYHANTLLKHGDTEFRCIAELSTAILEVGVEGESFQDWKNECDRGNLNNCRINHLA